MFSTIRYLETGTEKQQEVYHLLQNMGIMNCLAEYSPVLCGTIPIGIDVDKSDLDIVVEVKDFDTFEKYVRALYGHLEGFSIDKTLQYIVVRFVYDNYHFELYGENTPVNKQNAYVHMVIEHFLLKKYPDLREKIILLKKEGMKTEPAFCKVLGIEGDPYIGLINYMKK